MLRIVIFAVNKIFDDETFRKVQKISRRLKKFPCFTGGGFSLSI